MATLTFDTRTLRDALRWVVDHIDPKPSNAADSGLLISPPKDGHIILAGGSAQSSARARIPYTGDTFDEMKAVHAHSLSSIVKSAPGPQVNLTFNESSMLVKSGAARSKVTYLKAEDVTAGRTTGQIQRQITIPAAELINAVSSLSTLPGDDTSHPELSGLKLQLVDNKLAIAATDRSILGATKISATIPENSEGLELDALVPHKVLNGVVRALPTDGDVYLHWDSSNMRRMALSTDSLWASFTLLASPEKFPEYAPILDVPATTTVEIDRRALSSALTRAGFALGSEALVLGLSAATDNGTGESLQVKASGTFDHEEELPARVTGESAESALLSAQYVTQAVKAVAGDTVTLALDKTRVLITSDRSDHAQLVIPRVRNA